MAVPKLRCIFHPVVWSLRPVRSPLRRSGVAGGAEGSGSVQVLPREALRPRHHRQLSSGHSLNAGHLLVLLGLFSFPASGPQPDQAGGSVGRGARGVGRGARAARTQPAPRTQGASLTRRPGAASGAGRLGAGLEAAPDELPVGSGRLLPHGRTAELAERADWAQQPQEHERKAPSLRSLFPQRQEEPTGETKHEDHS
ncbi:hypothetical protein Cadr_000009347 [Camelus dromedarius]|uniref:Uncharacterized protein n=1 Tax=Camelus dromedarius TaxID=9838 RepID=A0A5N4DK23_CAMDR|nr:hypothetical protein Cadr_000009347 [Camelus dromedarius]